jgi:hypothetical protein
MYTFIAGVVFGIVLVVYMAKENARNSFEQSFGPRK